MSTKDDDSISFKTWFALIIGIVLFFYIENNFNVSGFWNHVMLFIFLLCGLPIATIFYSSFKEVADEKNHRNKSIDKESAYKKKELYLDVVGIFASKKRIREFENLNDDSKLCLEEDPYNEFDEYAIKVINCDTNGLIGFLERGQRKLLKTIKEKKYSVEIANKEQYYSKFKDREEYNLSIKISFS